MKANFYELSDRLVALRNRLADFEPGGVTLGGDQVRRLCSELKALGSLARQHETEISRHRWNEAGRADQAAAATVLAEAARPGSNLRLLAPLAAPFSDGRPPSRGRR